MDAGASGGAREPAPRQERIAWVDAAKGLGAVLVVIGHAASFSASSGLVGPWSTKAMQFASLPLPLFFFAAGVVSAGAVDLPFRQLLRRRVAPLLWVYLVWSVISSVVFGDGPHSTPLLRLARMLVRPEPNMWFVYALALYFVAAWALRRVPLPLLLPAAVLLAVLCGTGGPWSSTDPLDQPIGKTALGLFVFLVAIRLAKPISALVAGVRWWQALGTAVLYVAVVQVLAHSGGLTALGANALLSCLAVAAGMPVAAVLARRPLGRGLEALGRRSLPIYVLQFFPTILLPHLLGPGLAPSAALWFPPLLALGSLALALLAYEATRRIPGLYALPPILGRVLDRPLPVAATAPAAPTMPVPHVATAPTT